MPDTTTRTVSTRQNYDPAVPGGPLLAANAARVGFVFTNESGVRCYLHFGTSDASPGNYTFVLRAGEVLQLLSGVAYDGPVTYRWGSPTGGHLMVSEWLRTEA